MSPKGKAQLSLKGNIMENISHNNISLREELAIAYDEYVFDRDEYIREEAERLFKEEGYDAVIEDDDMLAKAYAIVCDREFWKADEEARRESEKALDEIIKQIKQTCEYLETHYDDRASLCGLVGLLGMYSDEFKGVHGVRPRGCWYLPDHIEKMVDTVSFEEMEKFWDLLSKNGTVAPYEI